MNEVISPVLIEEPDEQAVPRWFVSIDGPNPTAENVIDCESREDAGEIMSLFDAAPKPLRRDTLRVFLNCPLWGKRKSGHYGACGECAPCRLREVL